MRPPEAGDGLPVPAPAVAPTRFVIGYLDLGAFMAARDRRLAARSPVVAVLTTDGDGIADWLRAGQALEHVLLAATSAGLPASYLNQPLQVEPLRPRVAELLAGGGVPQVALRVGHPTAELPAAPRRPVADVILRS